MIFGLHILLIEAFFPLFSGTDIIFSRIQTSKQTKSFCCVETQFSELNLGITTVTRVPLEDKETKKLTPPLPRRNAFLLGTDWKCRG